MVHSNTHNRKKRLLRITSPWGRPGGAATRRQQKHDMLLTFMNHATTKPPAPLNKLMKTLQSLFV